MMSIYNSILVRGTKEQLIKFCKDADPCIETLDDIQNINKGVEPDDKHAISLSSWYTQEFFRTRDDDDFVYDGFLCNISISQVDDKDSYVVEWNCTTTYFNPEFWYQSMIKRYPELIFATVLKETCDYFVKGFLKDTHDFMNGDLSKEDRDVRTAAANRGMSMAYAIVKSGITAL